MIRTQLEVKISSGPEPASKKYPTPGRSRDQGQKIFQAETWVIDNTGHWGGSRGRGWGSDFFKFLNMKLSSNLVMQTWQLVIGVI